MESPFKWRHYKPEIILLAVRWTLRYPLSYRDLEEMMMGLGFFSYLTDWRTIGGYEAMHMISKGQL